MKIYDYVIVGGGASGCAVAVMLARKGKTVAVLDKNLQPAKKLLVTGNGKCNITNSNVKSEFYNQSIDSFLKKFGFEQTRDFFSSIGIEIFCDEMGRCYPLSLSAKSVQNAFINQFEKLGIDFFAETEFVDANKNDDIFEIETSKQSLQSKNLVIASGSNSIENFLIKNQIAYKHFVPSLVALKTKENTKKLDGVRTQNVLVKATVNQKSAEEYGEVLFKSGGISGICIFNLSALFARNDNFNGKITIDLFPKTSTSEIKNMLKRQYEIYGDLQKSLNTFAGEKLSLEIIKRFEQMSNSKQENSKNQKLVDSIDKQIEMLANLIKNLEFTVCGYYDNNQVFSGGVKLDTLTQNLENKKIANLYFCGEVCDVDGICGGFNLQWAWTSAFAVAEK